MKGSVRTVFPGNNSTRGFYSFYRSGLGNMEKICILKGGPGTGKSSFMRHLAERFRERGCDVELWQCSSDNDSLDGVLIPAYKTAVIDGTAPHTMDPIYPGVKEEILNFGDFWDASKLSKEREQIVDLTDRISATFASAYQKLKTAGELDAKVLSSRQRGELPTDPYRFADELFGTQSFCHRHLFAAAVTPNGVVDLTFDLCRDIKRRYFLRGNRGLGQQEYMKTLADTAEKRCISAEIYHGPLDPDEIVLVIFPELDLAVAAVEAIPSAEIREGDRIIAFHGTPPTEREKADEQKRNEAISDAVKDIMAAHELHDRLESYYIAAMDYEQISLIEKEFFQNVLKK